ncbi:MAG: DNA polymerase III subunit alpha [Nitrospira sp.]|nr:DNA polymerase III subunit alpha [Nitrospira sp.]
MTLALGITAYSWMEGIYLPEDLVRLARHLGYTDLAVIDRGLHGFPRLREAAEAAGLTLHLGCRLPGPGGEDDVVVLPLSRDGYTAMNKALTDEAHGRSWAWPEACALLADRWASALTLREQAPDPERVQLRVDRSGWQVSQRARAEGIPVTGPQVLRFWKPEGFALHKVKRGIALNRVLQDLKPGDTWEPRQVAQPVAAWEAGLSQEAIEGTRRLEASLGLWSLPWGTWVLPNPPHLQVGEDVAERLWTEAREGVRWRYGATVDPKVESRLGQEMDLILRKGYGGYFLVMQAITRNASRTCGRGSGAASLLAYVLGITNVDPVGAHLMFERFLNEDRQDPPDLDVDFAWDERDGVLRWVFDTFGRDHVAMVANHNVFQPRAAIREVAKLHCRPESELKRMSRRLRGYGWEDEVGLTVKLGRTSRADGPLPEPWDAIVATASRLVGQPHHLSVHPGGTVITPGPLWEHAPSQPAPAKEGVSILQWEKDGTEGYGLVKLDLLGNRSLAVVRDALADLGTKGQAPERRAWFPEDDPVTQDLLAKGDSIGVFYVESPATRILQTRVGRGDFEHLTIHSSLIRPAANRWIDEYVKRTKGEPFDAIHPCLKDLLSESYGVLVYQEDVMRVAQGMAGFTYRQADLLRKALGKSASKVQGFREVFLAGCEANGVSIDKAGEVWSMIETFTGYSFCKPHSASYARVSFESAWLKAHHPAEFFAAVINNQGGFYPAIAYLGDARRHGITVLSPDVTISEAGFTAEGKAALRVGLGCIKGLPSRDLGRLMEARIAGGGFEDAGDLQSRAGLSGKTMELLARAGAMDSFAPGGDRTRLLWDCVGGLPKGVDPRPTDAARRAQMELDLLGLTLEVHPTALARAREGGRTHPHRAAQVAQRLGRPSHFWGLVVAEKRVLTRDHLPMQFVTLEDETGLVEAVVFPDAFQKRGSAFAVGEVIPASGIAHAQDGVVILQWGTG